jgi:SSS family solute:Na+ symporter
MIILSTIDWITLATFILTTFFLTIFLSKKTNSLSSYFRAEGKLPWFVAGTAMVATTFGADTPLAVTEIVVKDGISGNWAWWYMSIGAVTTVFIFAPLWKRSGVLTDLELLSIRYSGIGSKLLRGIKAIYLGGLMNVLILAWVNLAMLSILESIFLKETAVFILIGLLLFGLLYTSLLGLGGISYIDVFQFFFAMGGCIFLAYFSLTLPEIGGLEGLQAKLPKGTLQFLPKEESLPSFLIMIFFLWWMSWYPGSEPGGGGYIAQRIISAKDEISATKSSLWFLFAHYFIRPWPWIIVALCSIVIFPDLPADQKGKGFILMIEPALKNGGKGILISTFIAAYLSTIATHFNWGASYLVNDLTKPYIIKEKSDKTYLTLSYFIQAISALASIYICLFWIKQVSSVWFLMIEASSGIGFALIFRWLWWRVSAWSELSGFLISPIAFIIIKVFTDLAFPFSAFATGVITVLCVIAVTFIFPSTEETKLILFYSKMKSSGLGWKFWAERKNLPIYSNDFTPMILGCISALTLVFSGLFLVGYLFFGNFIQISISLTIFSVSIIFLIIQLKKIFKNLETISID